MAQIEQSEQGRLFVKSATVVILFVKEDELLIADKKTEW